MLLVEALTPHIGLQRSRRSAPVSFVFQRSKRQRPHNIHTLHNRPAEWPRLPYICLPLRKKNRMYAQKLQSWASNATHERARPRMHGEKIAWYAHHLNNRSLSCSCSSAFPLRHDHAVSSCTSLRSPTTSTTAITPPSQNRVVFTVLHLPFFLRSSKRHGYVLHTWPQHLHTGTPYRIRILQAIPQSAGPVTVTIEPITLASSPHVEPASPHRLRLPPRPRSGHRRQAKEPACNLPRLPP